MININFIPYSPDYFDFIFELNQKETIKFRSDIVWDKIAESIYLHKIFIAEKYQRLGFGSNVIKILKSQGKTIECQANVQNQKSISFFTNQGFQISLYLRTTDTTLNRLLSCLKRVQMVQCMPWRVPLISFIEEVEFLFCA